MLEIFAKCFSRLTKKKSRQIRLLILGLDNAGKSTIINDLKGEPKESTIPTVGFSSVDFKLLNFRVTAYDVGGGPRIRGIWKDYYAEIFGMVYVVDSSDHERMSDSRRVLREALYDSRLAGKPFIVFANKQDIEGALSEQNIELQFELEQLAKKCESHYKVFRCTALLNGGHKIDSQLKKGLTWLLQMMNKDFSSLSERVQREMEIQKEADRKERAERLERVRKVREERERAERERETLAANELQDSDDDDVVFGNVLPRVKDISKAKKKRKKSKAEAETEEENFEETVKPEESIKENEVDPGEICKESLQENSRLSSAVANAATETKKRRKKKKKAKRNQTEPVSYVDRDENSDTGVILTPIAWKTPPASLNGFPGNGKKLEPLRPPLHNNLYLMSNNGLVSKEEGGGKFGNGHLYSSRLRPNEENDDVMT